MSSIRKFVFLAVLGFVKNSTAVDFSMQDDDPNSFILNIVLNYYF